MNSPIATTIPDQKKVGMVAWSSTNEGTLVAVFDGHQDNDFAPHVVRTLYPSLSNHYIIMTLGTSMAAIFGVEELTGRALNANAISFRSVEIFSITAGIYILLTIIASMMLWLLGRWLFRVKARAF